jgi:hypothetical protein
MHGSQAELLKVEGSVADSAGASRGSLRIQPVQMGEAHRSAKGTPASMPLNWLSRYDDPYGAGGASGVTSQHHEIKRPSQSEDWLSLDFRSIKEENIEEQSDDSRLQKLYRNIKAPRVPEMGIISPMASTSEAPARWQVQATSVLSPVSEVAE